MTISRRQFLKTGVAAMASGGFMTGEASARQTAWIPEHAKWFLGEFGINANNLQWDRLRKRDVLGEADCYDRNDDGVADALNGHAINGGDYRYTLIEATQSDVRHWNYHLDVTKAEAVETIGKLHMATGFLVSVNGERITSIQAVYHVNNGQIQNVARPLSDQPTGDLTLKTKPCASLKMP